MRTNEETDFVSLLYTKQILTQKLINTSTQFLRRGEGSFQEASIENKKVCHQWHQQQNLRHENNLNFEPRI